MVHPLDHLADPRVVHILDERVVLAPERHPGNWGKEDCQRLEGRRGKNLEKWEGDVSFKLLPTQKNKIKIKLSCHPQILRLKLNQYH